MYLLPEMCPEDLDERNLQSWDLAVHEDPGEVKLHLEAYVDVSSVDSRRPPEGETMVWYLIKTRTLSIIVNFLYFIDSSNLLAFSLRASHHMITYNSW